jgi:hypothetical protein
MRRHAIISLGHVPDLTDEAFYVRAPRGGHTFAHLGEWRAANDAGEVGTKIEFNLSQHLQGVVVEVPVGWNVKAAGIESYHRTHLQALTLIRTWLSPDAGQVKPCRSGGPL